MVSGSKHGDDYRLDEIDRLIVHALMTDARSISAPDIADDVNVSAGTIRNRIGRLEEHGIVTGYHAAVDFERADGSLANLFLCNVPFPDIERVTAQAGGIPGVIDIRELMGGRTNLHVLAVGENTSELRRIGRQLSEIGVEIEDEMLVKDRSRFPYGPFGPEADESVSLADSISLAGGAEVIDIPVDADAPVVGLTVEHAVEEGLLPPEALLVAIERDDETITPHGDTVIQSNDIVTVFSRDPSETVLNGFEVADPVEVDE